MNKLISVLLPVYNSQKWLSETINSILNQTYTHWELILVDDGSTDDSLEIARTFEERDVRIKVYFQENLGACAARNKAFEYSKGLFIQYLDSDDLLEPNKLETQVMALKNLDRKGIVFGRWSRIDEKGNSLNSSDLNSINKGYENPVEVLVNCWLNNEMVPVHSWLTPRQLIDKAGAWDNNLSHNQDGEFFSRVIANASKVIHCPVAKVYYRSNISGSISSKANSRKSATSQLISYQLYVKNLKDFISIKYVRIALANNFLLFVYQFYNEFPDLSLTAEKEFKNLQVGKMWPVGGMKFQRIANLVGFKNALWLKSLFK